MVLSALVSAGQNQVPANPIKQDDRRPPSEKMLEKPFGFKRRLVQNMVTRYNYYYHAKLKLEGVLKSINTQRQDNYNVFLPFYPFTVEKMNLSTTDLDSVVQKASIAVQIHDPRGKWIDDCYLLIGKAYYYKGDWENANKTFQYINAVFAPKVKEESKAVVGRSEDAQLSIATREKKRWFKHTSARNDAFVWQARSFLDQGKHDEAQSLLNILENDPYFPKRLQGELAELQAYRFYKQGRYAETIAPLSEAIRLSRGNREKKARMSFILGQLYASRNVYDSAIDAFRDVIAYKPDALMDFNARVQIAKANVKASGGNLAQSVAALQNMLRKERFLPFRDAIYYNMALISANEDPEAALGYLQKALNVESANMMQKTLSFMAIADINYFRKDYLPAQRYYDSTASIMGPDFEMAGIVNTRKEVLTEVAAHIATIRIEDSLQKIAALPPAEREALLAQQVAEFRKARSAAEQQEQQFRPSRNNAGNEPFGTVKEEPGDWYFYNASSKSNGYSEFKRRWGNRQLADNWRRSQSGVIAPTNSLQPESREDSMLAAIGELPPDSVNTSILAANLPITPEQMDASRQKQMDAWFQLGKLYNDKLDDPREAIATYDSLLTLYPDHPRKRDVIFSLYVWHDKLGHVQQAARYKQMILTRYEGSDYANIIRYGAPKDENSEKAKAVSMIYDSAYIAYLTGRYDTVFTLKHQVDSTYGNYALRAKFDLLEAMTIIKTRSEEAGKAAIAAVINKYPGEEGVLAQAMAIQDALNRRQQIVEYLTQLQVQKDNSVASRVDENIRIRYPWQQQQQKVADSTTTAKDTTAAIVNAPPPPPPPPVTPYKLSDEKAVVPHFVVMRFNRVSKLLVDSALAQFTRYNAEKHATDKIETSSFVLTPSEIMLIFRLFPNEDKALAYFDEIVKLAPATIIPRIRPTEYKFFIISRENFILLNNTKDIEGYRKFFDDNYITE